MGQRYYCDYPDCENFKEVEKKRLRKIEVHVQDGTGRNVIRRFEICDNCTAKLINYLPEGARSITG